LGSAVTEFLSSANSADVSAMSCVTCFQVLVVRCRGGDAVVRVVHVEVQRADVGGAVRAEADPGVGGALVRQAARSAPAERQRDVGEVPAVGAVTGRQPPGPARAGPAVLLVHADDVAGIAWVGGAFTVVPDPPIVQLAYGSPGEIDSTG
jgi:hypothetical protein